MDSVKPINVATVKTACYESKVRHFTIFFRAQAAVLTLLDGLFFNGLAGWFRVTDGCVEKLVMSVRCFDCTL